MQSPDKNNNDGYLFGSQSIGLSSPSPTPVSSVPLEEETMLERFSNKNMLIMILTVLLVFSFLGINLITVFGNFVERVIQLAKPLIVYVLSLFGYTAGSILSTTADVVGDTIITGMDIAQDSVKSAGEVLKGASKSAAPNLDWTIQNSQYHIQEPEPVPGSSPIVAPASKQSWCLVGEHMEKRGCIQVDEYDKCMSGQVYPSLKMCLNPNLTP